jgi:hypothetical protein
LLLLRDSRYVSRLIEISFVVANYHYSAEIHDEIKCVRNAGSLMLDPKYLKYKGRGKTSASRLLRRKSRSHGCE